MRKPLGKTEYEITVQWLERTENWGELTAGWDGQFYYEIYTADGEQIGEAAFCEADDKHYVIPCDFYDLAIKIDPDHRRNGIGSALIEDIQDRTDKTLKRRHADSTEAGDSLMDKHDIPYVSKENNTSGMEGLSQ